MEVALIQVCFLSDLTQHPGCGQGTNLHFAARSCPGQFYNRLSYADPRFTGPDLDQSYVVQGLST